MQDVARRRVGCAVGTLDPISATVAAALPAETTPVATAPTVFSVEFVLGVFVATAVALNLICA